MNKDFFRANRDFFKAAAIWGTVANGAAVALFLPNSWPLSRVQWLVGLGIFLAPFACTAVLRFLLRFLRGARAAAAGGLVLGIAIAILGGAVLMPIPPGFESPAIFAIGLMFTIPNGIGGALAGWILGRAAFPNREELALSNRA
jgi:hypothetical protein